MGLYLVIQYAVAVIVLVQVIGNLKHVYSMELRYEDSTQGLDTDDNYRVKVTRGQKAINSTLTRNGHYGEITISVFAFGKLFELDLKLNTYLFAVGYVERSVNRNGALYHDVNHTEGHCYYVGQVRGHLQSVAAASTCNGIVGYFAVGNVSYHIHPESKRLHGPHKIFRSQGDSKTVYRCGNDEVSLDVLLNTFKHRRRLKRSFIWPQDLDKKTKIVELFVANDHSQFLSKGSDFNAVVQRTKNIVNTASITYQSLDIYVVLVGIDVWNVSDMINVYSSNPNETLSQWSSYRMRNINPFHYNDNGILITSKTFNNGAVVGLANLGKMCSNQYSAAFVSDVHQLSTVASTIMNHEMGHNFNLIHDDYFAQVYGPCPCADPTGQCIMYTVTSAATPSKTWSQCSKDALANSFQHGLDICLYNIPPTVTQTTALCGNGIVEDGEQCDCGNSTSQECNSKCCSPVTCQLIAPATCAYGRCCNIGTCQILQCGSVCRSKAGDCDLAEFCNGVNGLCPKDTHKPDGTSCTEDEIAAYCYDGLCRSRESQCQLLWGPETPVSVDNCYSSLNTRGEYYGNCGLNWLPNVTYVPCQPGNVKCGRMQCKGNSTTELNYYSPQNRYKGGAVTLGSDLCLSVIFDFGLDTQDPGLVPNGASCGVGKMCVKQQCVNVTSVSTTPCTSTCQQNQVCNNVGQCQNMAASCPQITSSTTTTTTTTKTTTTMTKTTTTTSKPATARSTSQSMTLMTIVQSTAVVQSPAQTSGNVNPRQPQSNDVILGAVFVVVTLIVLAIVGVISGYYFCPATFSLWLPSVVA